MRKLASRQEAELGAVRREHARAVAFLAEARAHIRELEAEVRSLRAARRARRGGGPSRGGTPARKQAQAHSPLLQEVEQEIELALAASHKSPSRSGRRGAGTLGGQPAPKVRDVLASHFMEARESLAGDPLSPAQGDSQEVAAANVRQALGALLEDARGDEAPSAPGSTQRPGAGPRSPASPEKLAHIAHVLNSMDLDEPPRSLAPAGEASTGFLSKYYNEAPSAVGGGDASGLAGGAPLTKADLGYIFEEIQSLHEKMQLAERRIRATEWRDTPSRSASSEGGTRGKFHRQREALALIESQLGGAPSRRASSAQSGGRRGGKKPRFREADILLSSGRSSVQAYPAWV